MGRTQTKGLGWLWGLSTLLLALGFFATGARSEETDADEPEDGSKATVIDVSGDRSVTENEDGSKTVNTTVTRTNGQTGTVQTAINEVNVQKTETGREWTRETAVSGSNGFNQSSSTAGSSTNDGDGTGSWNSTTNGTVSGPKGNSVDYTTERAGEWNRNDQGGRDFSSTATTTTSNGGTSTVDRNLSTYQVSDGVKGFTGDTSRSFGNGATVDRSVEGTVTKTETGRSWDTTIQGTATGPNGQTRSWTTDVDGSVTRNEDGSLSLSSEKTVTGQNGGTVTVDKDGTLIKGDDGKWHYEGSKEVSHTPPTTGTSATTSVTADRSATENSDGSKTINSTATSTNQNTGVTRTVSNETTVQQTETGKAWTRETNASGSRGGSLTSSTTGSSTNNGDGSGSWSSATNGTVTGPRGNSTDYTTDRTGTWQKNDQGGRDFNSTATTATSHGGTSTVDRALSTSKLSDTEKAFTGSSNRTFGNGSTVDRNVDGVVTKTETGRSWSATGDGTATGPQGNSTSWSGSSSGAVNKNEDGTYALSSQKTVTGEKGGQATVSKEGVASKGDDGKWHYEGSKQADYTPSVSAAEKRSAWQEKATQRQVSGTESATDRWAKWQNETSNVDRLSTWKERAAQNQQNASSLRTGDAEGSGSAWRDRLRASQENRTRAVNDAGAARSRLGGAGAGADRPVRARGRR